MKRYISVILVAFCVLLSGCGNRVVESKPNTESKKLSIACTVFPSYDFSREIVGDKAEVTFLLPSASEAHSYTPTLSDIALIEECDVFIYVGGETDPWAKDIIDNSSNKERLDISLLELCGVSEPRHDEHSHEADGHVWTSLENSKKIVYGIATALKNADNKNAAFYNESAKEYSRKLTDLQSEYKEAVKKAKRDTLIFADRFPFYWLLEELGLNHVSALEGCSSDTEPTLTAVKNCIETVESSGAPSVFYIENSKKTIAKRVADETGCDIKLLHSCHNISKEEKASGETYLSLMQKNLESIKGALS